MKVSMIVGLVVKMFYILVLCRVLLIAGVQTLTIDSQLGTSIEDCFERASIGEHLPSDAIYRNVSELTNRECEQICKQDKQCQAYDYGVGAKGNATCNLSTLDEKTIKEQNPLKRHPDYDVYIRRFQCEQSPPTPIQPPLSDDPGPQHRPVFRPEIDERPSAEDYLISGDLGYEKPQESYRPDDVSNTKPDYDVGPSYGDHRPQDVPFRPGKPQDSYRPNRPNDKYRPNDSYRPERPQDLPYGPVRPNDPPYGAERPEDLPYGSNRPQKPSNDVLQFQDKPQLSDEYNRPDPYKPEKPTYHYIVRPNRKPRPQNDYPQNDPYGHPSGPIGPPNTPYRPTRPHDKPTYSYNGQYASNYGQNTQNDNSIYVEINDPPRPYIPIKDRPNQQYNGLGYLGYGTYSSQNSYSQSQNNQYSSYITELGGYGQKPAYSKPTYEDRPQKPAYGTSNSDYGNSQRPDDYEKPYGNQGSYGNNQGSYGNQDSYGSSQSSYGSNQNNYDSFQTSYNTNKGSYSSNKGSHSSQSDLGSNYGGYRPTDSSNYGEIGYGSQNQGPNDYKRPSSEQIYGNQNSYKGSHSSSYSEQNSHQSNYNSHASYETHRPSQGGYSKPQKPYDKPYESHGDYGSSQGGYNSNQGGYDSTQGGHVSSQGVYDSTQAGHVSSQGGYGSSLGGHVSSQGGYGSSGGGHVSSQVGYGSSQGDYSSNQGGSSSNQGSYNNNKGSYTSTQSSYGGSSNYGSNQGNYGTSYDKGSDGYGQSENRPGQNYGGGGYDNTQGYGSNQNGYGSQSSYGSQGGYGFSSSHYGQSHGESQYADHNTYGGYQKPGHGRPDYNNRPDYDYERPVYGQKPGYGQRPIQDQSGYGQKPGYDDQSSGYGSTQNYNDPIPGYNKPRPGYIDPKPSYNDEKPGYNDEKPGYTDPKPGYNNPKPDYNFEKPSDSDKPDPPYQLDVKPVYEYDLDRPNNVPAYISRPGGEVVTSQPVVIGDYGERPGYKEPGVPRKDVSYKACFRRVLAGQRALRSFVRRVVSCERLEDCRRECAEERRFHCESFNYRLDPSFRGKGLCELMTKPIEAFDIQRDFVQDKDYDFYEIDRNSLEPNCPETLRGPGLLHSGFLSSKDRIDDRNRPDRLDKRPNRIDGWRDRNDWVGGRGDGSNYQGYKGGNRRNEDRFVPYQIGTGRPDNQEKWGQYGGEYGGSQYYKNRNDFHKSISHWGLTSERPTYGVKPYQHTDEHRFQDRHDFDYNSLGKNLRKYFESTKDDTNDYSFSDHSNRNYNKHDRIDYHGNDRHEIDYHKNGPHYSSGKDDFGPLGRDDGRDISSGEDYYGVGKSLHRYGYGAWKRGRWNALGVSNGIDEEDLGKEYHEAADRSDESSSAKDCFSRRRPGMSLSTGAIRRSLIARSVLACESACFQEKEFKCVSYSYRYSNSRGIDNCFLSERPFHGLDLSSDSGSDVYAMPQDQACSTISQTPWIESECFYHVRSDTAVSGSAVQSALTVAGLGACEAECIRARGFFCRGFSFRFDSPTIGEELHNCILTSSPTTSLSGGSARRAGGHELYARGNYGRGCEPHANDVKDNGECYLQYDKAAKLTPSATRGRARVKDEQTCSNACTEAPFRCLSFSYRNNAPPDIDNCLLSEIRLFDLQKDVDYVHSGDDWLFAFDLFNSKCWRQIHSEEPSSEIPHPIHPSSEEDFPSGPSGNGYLPDTSGPSGPPSGPPNTPSIHLPGSGPPSGPSYHPHPPEDYKPHPPSGPSKPYLAEPGYKPESYPGYKPESYPGYKPDSYPGFKPGHSREPDIKPGYGPPEHKPSYRPDEPYRPGYPDPRPEYPSSRPSYPDPKPGYRPEEPFRPGYPDPEPNRPAYRPETPLRPPEREGHRPFRPEPSPDPRPELPGPYRPVFTPSGSYPGNPLDSGFRPGSGTGYGERPEYGGRPGHGERPGIGERPAQRPERPGFQGDREGGPLERHYTVSGFPCRTGTTCAQNVIVGHWACEPEGGEIGSWDYCCAPSHRCGYSEGFHKPWCYVGPKEDQWRPCSEKYYPYHQHNVPHPSSQGHRENHPQSRPWHNSQPQLPPLPDRQYWDDLYTNGPTAYYDKYGNPLPGYTRVPTEERPHIRNRYNPSRPGSGNWVPVSHDDPTGVPGSLGAPRYWPVAYLHKDPPPNTTYFRYNETRPTTTTERNDQTTTPPSLSRELPSEPRNNEPSDDLDAKSTRVDKKINVSSTDEVFNPDVDNDTVANTTTAAIPIEKEVNVSEVESIKTESYKELDRIDGIDDKLHDFTKSIEVFDIEDAKDDKSSDLKMLEAEERQIEEIGRLLAARRGTKLVIEKRSQKDLESKNIAVDKDLVDFNFGNRFPTSERRGERRGVIKRISKDEIERDRNIDRSLEVSETTFVRPPRVLSTTENIRKAIVNGKVFYDATIREQRDLLTNTTQKPINLRHEETTPFVINKNFREQRDAYLNSTRKPKHLKQTLNNVTNIQNNSRRAKNIRIDDPITNIKNIREERDTKQNNTGKGKRRNDDSITTYVSSSTLRELYNSSRKAKSLRRLEESSTPSVFANNNFGKRKTLIPRNVNPVRRVRRVYRKRYNPEEVRKRLLERDRNKNSTEASKKA